MDELILFAREQIALEGEDGIGMAALGDLLRSQFKDLFLDDAMMSYIWAQLSEDDSLTVHNDLVVASKDLIFLTITGTSIENRPSQVTDNVFRTLQFVTKNRDNGGLVQDITSTFGFDARSTFFFARVLEDLGYIKKVKAITSNSVTNRLVNVRFLDSPKFNRYRDGAPQRDVLLDKHAVYHRICRALEDAKVLPLSGLVESIGLKRKSKSDDRRLTSFLIEFFDKNLFEKRHFAKDPQSSAITFARQVSSDEADAILDADSVSVKEELDDSHALGPPSLLLQADKLVPFERQIYDLLGSSPEAGITKTDLSMAMSAIDVRVFEHPLDSMIAESLSVNIGPQIKSGRANRRREKFMVYFRDEESLQQFDPDDFPLLDPKWVTYNSVSELKTRFDHEDLSSRFLSQRSSSSLIRRPQQLISSREQSPSHESLPVAKRARLDLAVRQEQKPTANISRQRRVDELVEYLLLCDGVSSSKDLFANRKSIFYKGEDDQVEIDRKTLARVVDLAKSQNAVLVSNIVTQGETVSVLRLPSVDTDSDVYRAHVESLSHRRAPRRSAKPRLKQVESRPIDIDMAPEYQQDLSDLNTPAAVRDHFKREPRIYQTRFGYYHGEFARLRELHLFLLDAFGYDSDSPRITMEYLLNGIPLPLYVKLFPVPNDENPPWFTHLLTQAVASGSAAPLKSFGERVMTFLENDSRPRLLITESLMNSLAGLGLVRKWVTTEDGLVPQDSEQVMASSSFHVRSGSLWTLNHDVGLYDVGQRQEKGELAPGDNAPKNCVLAVHLSNRAVAEQFWSAYRALSLQTPAKPFHLADFSLLMEHQSTIPLPSTFPGSIAQENLLRVMNHWAGDDYISDSQRKVLASLVRRNVFDVSHDLDVWASAFFMKRRPFERWLAHYKDRSKAFGINRRLREIAGLDSHASKSLSTELVRELAWSKIVAAFNDNYGPACIDQGVLDYLSQKFRKLKGIDPGAVNDELVFMAWLKKLETADPQDAGTQALAQDAKWTRFHSIVPSSKRSKGLLRSVANKHGIVLSSERLQDAYAHHPHHSNLHILPKGNLSLATGSRLPLVNTSTLASRQSRRLQHESRIHRSKPRPSVRLARNYFDSAQDDLILELCAIVRVHAALTNNRVSYQALAPFFEIPVAKLRTRFLRLTNMRNNPQIFSYAVRLQTEWASVLMAAVKDGSLPDPGEFSINDFPIEVYHEKLLASIDKRSLKRPVPATSLESLGHPSHDTLSTDFPSSIQQLQEDFVLSRSSSEHDLDSAYTSLYSQKGTSFADKEKLFAATPYMATSSPVYKPRLKATHALLTMALLTTPQHYSVHTARDALIRRGRFENISSAVMDLEAKGYLAAPTPNSSLHTPQKFSLTGTFFAQFDDLDTLSPEKLQEAWSLYGRLRQGAVPWSVTAPNGSNLALLYLAASCAVDIRIDTAPTRIWPKATRSRYPVDATIECHLAVVPRKLPHVPDIPIPDGTALYVPFNLPNVDFVTSSGTLRLCLQWVQLDGSVNKDAFVLAVIFVASRLIVQPKTVFPALADLGASKSLLNAVDLYYVLVWMYETGRVHVDGDPRSPKFDWHHSHWSLTPHWWLPI